MFLCPTELVILAVLVPPIGGATTTLTDDECLAGGVIEHHGAPAFSPLTPLLVLACLFQLRFFSLVVDDGPCWYYSTESRCLLRLSFRCLGYSRDRSVLNL